MSNELGAMIGVVKTTCKTTIAGGGASVTNTIYIDFSTASDDDIRGWLASNRVIAGQRPWKNMSEEELKALDGSTFVAQSIGTKVKSRKEQVQAFKVAFMASGIDEKTAGVLATAAIDNPQALKVMEELGSGEENRSEYEG